MPWSVGISDLVKKPEIYHFPLGNFARPGQGYTYRYWKTGTPRLRTNKNPLAARDAIAEQPSFLCLPARILLVLLARSMPLVASNFPTLRQVAAKRRPTSS